MRILHVVEGLNVGGAESYLYNLVLAMNEEKYNFDFLIRNKNITNELIYKKCQEENFKIWITDSYIKHPIKNFYQVEKILSENRYDVIHIHANALIYITPIVLADKRNIKIVLHSHSVTNNKGGIIAKLVHNINRKIIKNIRITNIACSEEAGKWMFGEKEFQLINNAIDSEKYKYSKEISKKLKEENNLSNEIIIGHAGRFVDVKNHDFIIKIFYEYQKENPNSKLILLGDGPLKKNIERQCEELNIIEKVIFKGNISNVHEYLMIFDICLFPSKYEGLGFLMLEAQASGLPVLASSNVPRQAVITDLIFFEKLDTTAKKWSDRINPIINMQRERGRYVEIMQMSEVDIKALKKGMQKIYENSR